MRVHIRRNTIYSDYNKIILFLDNDDLIEMLYRKAGNQESADLIMDKVELFYLQRARRNELIERAWKKIELI
jgi:hypothetical protein